VRVHGDRIAGSSSPRVATGMSETDAEAAIVAHLVDGPADGGTGTGLGAPTRGIVSGGPHADPTTIVFQRSRQLPSCRMHFVAFTNRQGLAVEWVIRTWQNADGLCVVAPIGGGSAGGAPRRTTPWVNFAAGVGPVGFSAGGRVEGGGSEHAAHVRLIFKDGLTLDDRVENGIVLFFEPRRVGFPADVEILDRRQELLARSSEFDLFAG
jgi:hypothetical protein